MSIGFFDEKAIVALGFFVCVALIIKFFGKSFINFLSTMQNDIVSDINKTESKFDRASNRIVDLKKQQDDIKKENILLMERAEKEKEFLINTSNKKAEDLLNEAIQTQKILNDKILNEVGDSISKIPLDVILESIKIEILQSQNNKIQENLLDNTLDEALNLNIKVDEKN